MFLEAGAAVIVSMISAYCFLRLRCRKIGNPFGRRARRWALTIIGLAVVVSTGLGLALVAVSHHIRPAYVGLVLPSALWLGKAIPRDRTQPRSLLDGLMFPLRRLDDLMGEDMQAWCDIRSKAVAGNPAWVSDAAKYYHTQVSGRVKDERARRNLEHWRDSIRHKIKMARLAGLDSPERLRAALRSHPATHNERKYHPDDPYLAERLRSDAENELHLFLFELYRLGFYKLLIYPFRPPAHPGKRHGHPDETAGAEPSVRDTTWL